MRAVAGVMAPVRMSDGLNIPGAASEIRTLHLRRAGKRDAGLSKARACTANSPGKTSIRAGDFQGRRLRAADNFSGARGSANFWGLRREVPWQNVSTRGQFPKGVAGERRAIPVVRANLPERDTILSKVCAGTASSLHKTPTRAGDFPRVSLENGGKFQRRARTCQPLGSVVLIC